MALCSMLRVSAVLIGSVLILIPARISAQQPSAPRSVGIVTAIQGQAAVDRQALPQPVALRFRDDVFLRDQISTRERSTVRLLLGGRASVTVRELSQFTIEEATLPHGGQRSVLGLLTGKVGAAIAQSLMRPGETVEVRTPDAIAAVRGTVLVAEYIPPRGKASLPRAGLLASVAQGVILAQAPVGGTSSFFVFSGLVVITPLGLPPFTLGPMQWVSIASTPAGPQAGPIVTLTPPEATQLVQDLHMGKSHTAEPDVSKATQVQLAVSQSQLDFQSIMNQPARLSTFTASSLPNNTVAPVVPKIRTDPSESQAVRSIKSLSDLK